MTTSEVHNLCRKYVIKDYTINDGLVSVNGDVNLYNKQLTEIPIRFKEVTGHFDFGRNSLTSLKNCPETVGDGFYCGHNQLTSLEGCPEYVSGNFWCDYNQITSFDGLPEFFERTIGLYGNPVDEIYKLFNRDPRCIYWIREFGVIQGDEVVRDRLEEVFHTLGMDIPKNIPLKEYILK